jgi:hypothetical protein
MALKKAIATYEGGYEIEMHPLEEASIRAHWAIHDVTIKLPPKLSQQDEHEMLINEGAEAVRKSRLHYQAALDALQAEIQSSEKAYQDAHHAWCAHADHCVANGLDPDTHDKDRY